MDFMEQMLERAKEKVHEELETRFDRNPDAIAKAIKREPLKGLNAGDLLQQVKRGETYRDMWGDQPVVFVQYWDPPLRTNKDRLVRRDIVVSVAIDKTDGELIMFTVDSTDYQLMKDGDSE